MKIQFDELQYQTDAVQAVVDVFQGQRMRQSAFTLTDDYAQGKLFHAHGIGNRLDVTPAQLLRNVQQVQMKQRLPLATDIPTPFPQFNIEMETGTGKTFVYLKTILALQQQYGFTKFIIVVPSVAIKEGVVKTLAMTQQYFKAQMQGLVYRSFMYDSTQLHNVQAFAMSGNVEIMVMNIQAFSKGKKNEDNMNIIYRNDIDALYGVAPIELISATKPIVIIDEPQSVDNTENAQAAIAALDPSVVLRYSATHKNTSYPLLYRLGPVEAYEQKLVKQIEVASVKRAIDGNDAYMQLLSVKASGQSVTAMVEMYVKTTTGIQRKPVKLKCGDVLYTKSKRLMAYEQVGFVQNISTEPGNEYIEFSGTPAMLTLEQAKADDLQMKRAQIRQTIEEHLNKELKLAPKGIKVLSLFFIDNVANYRTYDAEGNAQLGIYAEMFEQEYADLMTRPKYAQLRDAHVPVRDVHNGYFSIDGKKKVKNTSGSSKEDETTYNIIMRQKEELLTMYDEAAGNTRAAHKYRFIFSHSALREGWDNPNVFQICTLVESADAITKRQKIGRGLRIAVNQQGERVPGFDVNTLTVMANESYEEFAQQLQSEYEEEGLTFGIFEQSMFSSIIVETDAYTGLHTPFGHEQSQQLVHYLREAAYIDEQHRATEQLVRALREQTLSLPPFVTALAPYVQEQIVTLIAQTCDAHRVTVKNHAKKSVVKLNKEALSEPFLALWSRIQYKTNYTITFDSARFIQLAAEKLHDELTVRMHKLEYEVHQLQTTAAGVSSTQRTSTIVPTTADVYTQAPDILTYLQEETKLTRKTLIAILTQSETLVDFARNPQMYMSEAARLINSLKRFMMVDGIKYEKRTDGDVYDQSLFLQEEIEAYDDYIVPVSSDRTLYDHVIVDSSIERAFAESCEQDPNVTFYIKLPASFTIQTPLGRYNPDWALALQKDGAEQLYFIVETKGNVAAEHLRPVELAKIRCGEKHFEAIATGITLKRATTLQTIY